MTGASGVRAAYDAIARAYDARLADELDHKPLDRALLAALLELAGAGTVADVGCGPGHVTRYLARDHPDVVGVDLSAEMIRVARDRAPTLAFVVGSMLRLPVADGSWAGAVALYSIIHLTPAERAACCAELARAVAAGGWLLLAFHVDSPDFAIGDVNHLTEWFGEPVHVDAFFLDPDAVVADVENAGFTVMSSMVRRPLPEVEYPSRRCYLMAQRREA